MAPLDCFGVPNLICINAMDAYTGGAMLTKRQGMGKANEKI